MSINRVFCQADGWIYCAAVAEIQSWCIWPSVSKPLKTQNMQQRPCSESLGKHRHILKYYLGYSSLHYPHRGEWIQELSWYCTQVCRWLFQVAEWQLQHIKIIWPCLNSQLEPRFTCMALLLAQYEWLQLWKAGAQPCCGAKALPNHHGTGGLVNPAVSWRGTRSRCVSPKLWCVPDTAVCQHSKTKAVLSW